MVSRKHADEVRGYDDVFLSCRDIRHVWEIVGFYRTDGIIRRLLECARCGMQRLDRWHTDGEREPSSYSAPEGYRVSDGGMDTWEVRREVLRRATVYPSQAAMVAALTEAGTPRVRRAKGDQQ